MSRYNSTSNQSRHRQSWLVGCPTGRLTVVTCFFQRILMTYRLLAKLFLWTKTDSRRIFLRIPVFTYFSNNQYKRKFVWGCFVTVSNLATVLCDVMRILEGYSFFPSNFFFSFEAWYFLWRLLHCFLYQSICASGLQIPFDRPFSAVFIKK